MVTTDLGSKVRQDLPKWMGRAAYALVALPLSLVGLVSGCLGGGAAVGHRHRRLADRLLGPSVTGDPPGTGRPRVFGHALVSLPVNLLAFVLAAVGWGLFLTRGVLYPAFGADNLEDSWGGPTLAGAWVVHFLIGAALAAAATLLLGPITRYQAHLVRNHLDAPEP